MGLVGTADSGLLGWCILAVDGVQTMMELAEVGKSGC